MRTNERGSHRFATMMTRAGSAFGLAAIALALVACRGDASVGAGRLRLCATDEGPRGAYCGALTVFEDRAGRSGRTIDLKIVVARALRRNPEPDALFVLVGEPPGLHQGRFDIRDGRALCSPLRENIATYPVRIEDGVVFVAL